MNVDLVKDMRLCVVQPREFALRVLVAHQTMNELDSRKRLVYHGIQLRGVQLTACRLNVHERAQQRARSASLTFR